MDKRDTGPVGTLVSTLFWGSLWGIWEATVGYVVHLVHVPGWPGLFMAPAAFYFMSRAFAETGKIEGVFSTACVAAGFKLLDLFIPGRGPQAVINPALAILFESLMLTCFYAFLRSPSMILPVFSRRTQANRG